MIVGMVLIGCGTTFSQELSLNQAKQHAKENNKRIKQASLQLDAANEVTKQIKPSYFPNVSAGAFLSRFNDYLVDEKIGSANLPVYDGTPANLPNATEFAYFPGANVQAQEGLSTAYVTAIQPLYLGGQIRKGVALSKVGVEVNELQLQLTEEQVELETERFYWNLISLKEKQQTLSEYETLINALKKDVQAAYDAGLVNKSDVLKVDLELNNVASNKLQLENGIQLAKMAMAQHIGVQYTESFEVSDSAIEVQDPSLYFRDHKESLVIRKEYTMLNKAVDAEELQRKIEFGKLQPSLSLGLTGMYHNIGEQDNYLGVGFVALSVPITDWWSGSHKLSESKIKTEIAETNLADKSELLQLEMQQKFNNLTQSYYQVEVAKTSVQQANENARIEKDNFDSGIISTSDLLEAQLLAQQAKDQLTEATTVYMIRRAEYLAATAQY